MCVFALTIDPSVVPSASRPRVYCSTHKFLMADPIAEGVTRCPVGQIEKARDEALAAINAARGGLPDWKVPNV